MKFKVGDKVRVVKPMSVDVTTYKDSTSDASNTWADDDMDECVGNIYKLEEFNAGAGWAITDTNLNDWFHFLEDWLELVEDVGVSSNKRHPHADMIISYANDCTQRVYCRRQGSGLWEETLSPRWNKSLEYKLEPTVKKMTYEEVKETLGYDFEIVESAE